MQIQKLTPAQLEERLLDIYETAVNGLMTEGDHHKQWFLQEIVKAVVGEEKYEHAVVEFAVDNEGAYWEEGIAP